MKTFIWPAPDMPTNVRVTLLASLRPKVQGTENEAEAATPAVVLSLLLGACRQGLVFPQSSRPP